MSTDFPYAFGTPPWDDQQADAYDDALSNTAYNVSRDLDEIIREALFEVVEDYFEIPEKHSDYILSDKEDFKLNVVNDVMNLYVKTYKK